MIGIVAGVAIIILVAAVFIVYRRRTNSPKRPSKLSLTHVSGIHDLRHGSQSEFNHMEQMVQFSGDGQLDGFSMRHDSVTQSGFMAMNPMRQKGQLKVSLDSHGYFVPPPNDYNNRMEYQNTNGDGHETDQELEPTFQEQKALPNQLTGSGRMASPNPYEMPTIQMNAAHYFVPPSADATRFPVYAQEQYSHLSHGSNGAISAVVNAPQAPNVYGRLNHENHQPDIYEQPTGESQQSKPAQANAPIIASRPESYSHLSVGSKRDAGAQPGKPVIVAQPENYDHLSKRSVSNKVKADDTYDRFTTPGSNAVPVRRYVNVNDPKNGANEDAEQVAGMVLPQYNMESTTDFQSVTSVGNLTGDIPAYESVDDPITEIKTTNTSISRSVYEDADHPRPNVTRGYVNDEAEVLVGVSKGPPKSAYVELVPVISGGGRNYGSQPSVYAQFDDDSETPSSTQLRYVNAPVTDMMQSNTSRGYVNNDLIQDSNQIHAHGSISSRNDTPSETHSQHGNDGREKSSETVDALVQADTAKPNAISFESIEFMTRKEVENLLENQSDGSYVVRGTGRADGCIITVRYRGAKD